MRVLSADFSMDDDSMLLRKSLFDFVAESFSSRSSIASIGVSVDNTLRRIQPCSTPQD